ncbi:hypothetical protein E1301_Tti007720 [Triplophysa tibetana]|uniref:Uncharacterized protein n=1 Tax=Triplophysa tibetana TaxID=1572043 RepID=A0A5A9PB18_9TELE|nr:hypothetical protein E1301_Tti007720 [Triplophysa tibetana]
MHAVWRPLRAEEGKARDLQSDCRIDERVSRGNCEEAHLQPTRGPRHPHIKRASSSVMYDAGYTTLSTRVEMGPSRDLSQGRMKGRSRGVCQTKAHKGQPYRAGGGENPSLLAEGVSGQRCWADASHRAWYLLERTEVETMQHTPRLVSRGGSQDRIRTLTRSCQREGRREPAAAAALPPRLKPHPPSHPAATQPITAPRGGGKPLGAIAFLCRSTAKAP